MGYEPLPAAEKKTPGGMFRKSYEKGTVIPLDFHCLEAAIKVLPKLLKGQYCSLIFWPLTLEQAFGKGKEGEVFLKNVREYSDKNRV